MEVREYIKNHVLVFDGAFGTYFAEQYPEYHHAYEDANIEVPVRVLSTHRQYVAAGCRALKTNTFGVVGRNMLTHSHRQIIRSAYHIACEAARDEIFVFADLGPAAGDNAQEKFENYKSAVDIFLECGAENFLFETLDTNEGLTEIVTYIREKLPSAFIMTSYAVYSDGYTREGLFYETLMREMSQPDLADVVGLNCVCGARHMGVLLDRLAGSGMRLSAMPNAGYPTVRGNRAYYNNNLDYFAAEAVELVQKGVSVIGGCCGTTPKHMELVAQQLDGRAPRRIIYHGRTVEAREQEHAAPVANALYEMLEAHKKVITVELDSPKDTNLEHFMKNARALQQAGADALTIADCPVAHARMDSTFLACKVKHDLDFDVIPHITCRDRNIIATKALLLAAYAEKIRNVLVVTGDPVPTAERDEVRTVFQFNSIKQAAYIHSLNQEVFDEPMQIFGALNINAVNFNHELERSLQKEEAGVIGFLTQPVLSKEAVENLKTARRELHGKILGGIMPVVSERNGRFMESEISGIHVADEVIERYIGKDRDECEVEAVKISREFAEQIAPYVDGYYLMTPFGRAGLMTRVIAEVKEIIASEK